LALPDSPVANALFAEPDFERYPLELNHCLDCGHLQLAGAPDPDGVFSEYRYKSGVSNSFKKHFEKYAADIVRQYGSGRVLEIGSNDGYLLEQFKNQNCKVMGIEPSKYLVSEHESKGVPVVNGFFSTELVEQQGWTSLVDIVCANNVLAHIPDTLDVIKGVFQALRPGGILVAECGDQSGIISGKYLDNVYHEHIDYYSPHSFAQLLLRADLVVEDVQKIDTHGVSFRIIARKKIGNHSVKFTKLDMNQTNSAVKEYIASRKENMKTILGDRKFVAYGAAAKAVTSLYTLDLVNENLTGVVDDNDLKQGYYFPGTDILITDPAKLDKDALVVVTAWNVYEDIKRKLVDRGHTGEIICMQ
jgi:2-polyprenyl-3-methyl-5-hydroxy-6-metoxy-1,4-benzoquinol methylase